MNNILLLYLLYEYFTYNIFLFSYNHVEVILKNARAMFYSLDVKKVVDIRSTGFILEGGLVVNFTDAKIKQKLYSLAQSLHQG